MRTCPHAGRKWGGWRFICRTSEHGAGMKVKRGGRGCCLPGCLRGVFTFYQSLSVRCGWGQEWGIEDYGMSQRGNGRV